MRELFNPISESIKRIIDVQNQFQNQFQNQLSSIDNAIRHTFVESGLLDSLQKFGQLRDKIINHPEYQFAFMTDLEALNLNSTEELKKTIIENKPDEYISEKEEILNNNLIPYLKKLELDFLWIGAEYALKSKDNPDKLRHCLISLRTILEYLIDYKLAPKEELKDIEMFKKEFKDYHLGKKRIEQVLIKREKKIEYFTSKIDFGVLDEFTKKDINYICDCYSVLCNIHKPNIVISENQVRVLKIKTGITIWLLVYIYDVINQ
jgi:hypothetical protein